MEIKFQPGDIFEAKVETRDQNMHKHSEFVKFQTIKNFKGEIVPITNQVGSLLNGADPNPLCWKEYKWYELEEIRITQQETKFEISNS